MSAIFATVISHPFDVVFTKIASQRSMKYIGIIDTLKTIVKEEGIKKLASGIEFRLLYTLSSTMIMGSFQDNFIKLTL